MQILLANAKIMYEKAGILANGQTLEPLSIPAYKAMSNDIAAEMAKMNIDELAKQLDCSRKLAAENFKRYQNFHVAQTMPAILAYNGQAYKHLRASTLTKEDILFGQEHLWITCFLYGLLRPMDAIVPYRMEHCVKLDMTDDLPINQFWKGAAFDAYTKKHLPNETEMKDPTQLLIDSVKADDGILVHLSTEEYEHLFDWNHVNAELEVIHPLFYVRQPNGELKMQAVWAKSCRGAMVRFILKNRITCPEDLQAFSYEGFEYSPHYGEKAFPHFIRE